MLSADSRRAGMVSGLWIASYLRLDRAGQSGVMTDKARIRIAATVTALFLAGISAAGLVAHGHQPQPAAPATTAAITAPSANATTAARGDDGGYGGQGYEEHEHDD